MDDRVVNIFIYEYAAAQPTEVALPASIRREGAAMLVTLVEDFSQLNNVQTLTMNCSTAHNEREAFVKCVGIADYALIVAPEIDGILGERIRWTESLGVRLLGSGSDVIDRVSDKWRLYLELTARSVPVPLTAVATKTSDFENRAPPWVHKPRQGAGSTDVTLIHEENQIPCQSEEWILQPFMLGQPASVAFLIGQDCRHELPPMYQLLSDDGKFTFLGSQQISDTNEALRATNLARRAIECFQKLRGYVGVDLILGNNENGSEDVVIEINPRLTTSYVELRKFTPNIARTWLEVVNDGVNYY